MSGQRVPTEHGRSVLVAIPQDWRPCAEHMRTLPESLRAYVRFLETNNDPEGLRADNIALRAENERLHELLSGIDYESARLPAVG